LQQWLANGWLKKHPATRQEILGLLSIVDRDIAECQNTGLSADWRLNIAYNAALQAATAALRASGFRTGKDSGSSHYYTVHSLAYTIGEEPALVNDLEAFRQKRNVIEYDRAGAASDAEAKQAVELAMRIRRDVVEWLRNNHPSLLQK
jgi:hypothetical protein